MILRKICKKMLNSHFDYKAYWDNRYNTGGNSGNGSYGELNNFKVNFINNFIKEKNIETVIDFGCGDGNQLMQTNYKKYLGLDVAKSSIKKCLKLFNNQKNKSFLLYDPMYFVNNNFFKADLVICIDVLYHIIPEEDFIKTLKDIFSCSKKYVILYTSIDAYKTEPYRVGAHVRHRDTMFFLEKIENYRITGIVANALPNLSSASFIILQKNNL